MYSFLNDYSEGAHPRILNRLVETNTSQQLGYGGDEYVRNAKQLIFEKLENSEARIYFVSGGTQANLLVISSLLRPHEAVISAATGHIYTHEAGAIEATGHRIIAVESADGKLQKADIKQVLNEYTLRPHVVKPKLVYISNTTELGTVYTSKELETLYQYCQSKDLILYIDGARLGHAMTSQKGPLTLADFAKNCDAFYIGGTKNGALLGEAIVFNKKDLAPEFDYALKMRGALLSKGRLLGIQFLTLFEDNLYIDLARHANQMTWKLADGLKERGIQFLTAPESNQVFPILPNECLPKLREDFLFYDWKSVNNELTAIRLITSWATEDAHISSFLKKVDASLTQKSNL
jgi:threonine aldolase